MSLARGYYSYLNHVIDFYMSRRLRIFSTLKAVLNSNKTYVHPTFQISTLYWFLRIFLRHLNTENNNSRPAWKRNQSNKKHTYDLWLCFYIYMYISCFRRNRCFKFQFDLPCCCLNLSNPFSCRPIVTWALRQALPSKWISRWSMLMHGRVEVIWLRAVFWRWCTAGAWWGRGQGCRTPAGNCWIGPVDSTSHKSMLSWCEKLVVYWFTFFG